jgi:hypothetical protein
MSIAGTAGWCPLKFISFGSHLFCSPQKVLAECRKCETGATVGPVDGRTWILRYLRPGAEGPCKISVPTIKGRVVASSKLQKTDDDDTRSKTDWNPGADVCSSCGHDFEEDVVVSCSLNHQHKYCQECFSDIVRQHVNGTGRNTFIESGIITCPYCATSTRKDLRAAFDMRVCSQFLDEALYSRYLTCFSEREVIRMQQDCEERLKAAASTSSAIAAPIDQDIVDIREFQCLSY